MTAVSSQIEDTVDGASVTTAADLAKRVSGTLVDAKNLASKLGSALAIVALLAAFLIASLLTLSSVAKRIREFGTLKALGWSQWLIVRQVTGESLFQGLLGGAIGVCLGIAGAAAIAALSPSLTATVSNGAQQAGGFFGGGGPGPFGQGQVAAQATEVALGAPGQRHARRGRGWTRRPRGAHCRSGRQPPCLASAPCRCPPTHRLR